MKVSVAVIDLGTSNIGSLTSALAYLGVGFFLVTDGAEMIDATHVILPGVGAFDAAMARIDELDLREPLRRHATCRPLLGVCLGMQLLFDGSEEGRRPGTGLIAGFFRRLAPDAARGRKVPHVGFSPISGHVSSGLFNGLAQDSAFYFTHSYALPSLPAGNVALCHHSQSFVAAFQHANICGAQFHPEKSQSNGLRLLSNFLEL